MGTEITPSDRRFVKVAGSFTADDLAWAAGLFDGEGTATECRGRARLAVQMNDRECVERFAVAVGCGTTYGPYTHEYKDGYTRQPRFVWLAEGDDYETAARLLMPLLGATKRAAVAKNVKMVCRAV